MCFWENFGRIRAIEMQAILSFLKEKNYPYEKALAFIKEMDGVTNVNGNYTVELEKVWDTMMETPELADLLKKKNIETHSQLVMEAIEHYGEYES